MTMGNEPIGSAGNLLILPASVPMLEYELAANPDLFRLIDVEVPPYWPPELNDEDSFRHFLGVAQMEPSASRWGFYYALSKQPRRLVGCGGFIGPPDESGQVEIGYSILRTYRRQGLATEFCRLLVQKAKDDGNVRRVIASTYPDLQASIGVLEKCGFAYQGHGPEGTVVYGLDLDA